jgi:hypothetical protein
MLPSSAREIIMTILDHVSNSAPNGPHAGAGEAADMLAAMTHLSAGVA